MQVDQINKFGNSFQSKLTISLMTDKVFLQQVLDILEPDSFNSDSRKWIIKTIKEYFNEYKTTPTMEVMKIKLRDVTSDTKKAAIVENLKDAFKQRRAEDLDFVKVEAIRFFFNQNLKGAILESVDLLEVGKYDDIKSIIDDAMRAGVERDLGHMYNEEIEERYENSRLNVRETPWKVLNELMGGGCGGGELCALVAPAGIGKTTGLINIGKHAVESGLNVIHYTLELYSNYVGQKYDACLTGIPIQSLEYSKEEVSKKISKLKGQLIIKHFPTKSASITSLSAHIEKCILKGIKPDLIILDYADLLRDRNGSKELRHALGNIYEDLRGLAGEYEVPIWTASQANRSSLESDIIEADKISEAYNKVMIADFVISLSRKVADKISGTGRWHVIKNRFGPDGITFPSKINTTNCQIEIFDNNTETGQDINNSMKTGETAVRKLLGQKHQEFTQGT